MNLKKIAQGAYKFGIKYIPRITPGVGLVSLGMREYKKRKGTSFPYYNLKKKEDKIVMGSYALQIGLLVFSLLKAALIYSSAQSLTKGIEENYNFEQVEGIPTVKKGSFEEKTIDYQDSSLNRL